MNNVFTQLDRLLADASESASMKQFGCGFPNERIVIKSAHFPDKGFEPGTEMHPTDYVKAMVQLHHETWVISPIERVRALLRTHAELLERCQELAATMDRDNLQRIAQLAAAGRFS